MAIAGRVAMIPKGDYDATVTYQILDVVRYNDASYVAKKSSTGILPTDTEYWMLMTQDGLLADDAFSETSERPVQNKVVNEAIQNILNGTTPAGDSEKLGGKKAALYALHIDGVLSGSESILEKAKTLSYGMWNFRFSDHDGTDLPKFGYVYGMATVFVRTSSAISVYLWGSAQNKQNAVNHWDGTSWTGWTNDADTVDGYHASDFALLEQLIEHSLPYTSFSGKTVAELEAFLNNYSADMDADTVYEFGVSGLTGYAITGGAWKINGYKCNNTTEIQIAITYTSTGVKVISRSKVNNTWSDWSDPLATTADLAGYVSKTGDSTIDGNIEIKSNGNAHRMFTMSNPLRNIQKVLFKTDGTYYEYDVTNGKYIYKSNADGTNTFYGIASECLPITGATAKSPNTSNTVMTLQGTKSESVAYLGFVGATGAALGLLGFTGANKPVFVTKDAGATYELLHSGNYADYTVYKGTSAPSSTTCIWVDIANKVIKAYIDGAWTQVS